MSIFPDHSLGVFNLWIMVVLYGLPILLTIAIRKRIFQATSFRFKNSQEPGENSIFIISKILMLIYFLYSFVVPVRLDTVPGIIGLTSYLFGFAVYTAGWITVAKSDSGEMFSSGPFRFSRHPIYFASAVQFFGAGLISQSWVYLGLSILVGISHMGNALVEEQTCLEAFGDEYRHYMRSTPRWFGWRRKKYKTET